VPRIGHVDPTLPIHGQRVRFVQFARAASDTAELGDIRSIQELLDAMIEPVGDVDAAGQIDGDVERVVELPVAAARATLFQLERTAERELLDAVVRAVGDVDL
jgi:hypothetical protein